MQGTYKNLKVTVLDDPAEREKHMGYKYLIYDEHWTSHSACRTDEGFIEWLRVRGLQLGDAKYAGDRTFEIIGEFTVIALLYDEPQLPDLRNSLTNGKYWTAERFNEFGQRNELERDIWMSNGSWTTCYIFRGSDLYHIDPKTREYKQVTIIYYLNPNCKDREIHDWRNETWR